MAEAPSPKRQLVDGSLRILLSEALMLPAGIGMAALLTRGLGVERYGAYSLAASAAVWIEFTIAALLTRPAIKVLTETDDWRAAGATVLRLYLATGIVVAALVWLGAGSLATSALGDPTLETPLALAALDIPLFCVVQAYRNLLAGTGQFRLLAWVGATRWILRLAFVAVAVGADLGVEGAVLAMPAASLVEILVARGAVRLPILGRAAAPLRPLVRLALSLATLVAALRFFDRADLFFLKALGGSVAEAGWYAAAKNLAVVPALLGIALSQPLQAGVGRAVRDGDMAGASRLVYDAQRIALLLAAPVGFALGAAPEIASAIYGAPFAASAGPLRLLLLGSIAMVLFTLTTSALIGAGRAGLAVAAAAPLALLAPAGYALLVPRYGGTGAAFVTCAAAAAAALVSALAVYRVWRLAPPLGAAARSALAAAAAYAVAVLWPTPGLLVVAKACVAAVAAFGLLLLLGGLAEDERTWIKSLAVRTGS